MTVPEAVGRRPQPHLGPGDLVGTGETDQAVADVGRAPSASTSHSRTKTSAYGKLEQNQISALTSPITSVSCSSSSVVYVNTSGRASSFRLSTRPAFTPMAIRTPPTAGVGSAGS